MADKGEPSFLKDVTPPGKGEPPDPEALTIAEMNGSTALRPANKLLTRLHIVLKDGSVHTMIYHHLDSNAHFHGDSFTLVFIGAKHWSVTVKGHGPKFWAIFDYITLFRWAYIREEPRDFKSDKDATVFTEITIRDVTPKLEA